MRYLTPLLILPILIATPATADELAMTVYNSGQALVSDSRDIPFRRGEQVIELPGVSSDIQPATVTFVAPDIDILEQNFDFDLLSPQKLMEKAVGSYVTLIRINPGTGRKTEERAKVLSVNNGVIVQVGERIEVLRDDDIPTRVVFPKVPENLKADPTLSITVDSARGGTREAALSYLTGGLSWRADYVAVFDETEGSLDMQGWATLINTTDTTFEDARVAVLAAELNGSFPGNARGRFNPRFNPQPNFREAGTETSPQERVGGGYLYPLPGQITVKSNQTKQVGIVDLQGVEAEKRYEYSNFGFRGQSEPQDVAVRIGFSNSGQALPAGTFRVYAEDSSGRTQFIGEDGLDHIPAGSGLAVKIGEAFDIKVTPTVVKTERIGKDVRDITMRYRVSNASPEAVEVVVNQQGLQTYWADYEILEESQGSERPSAGILRYRVDVPANGDKVLEFKLRERRRS